MKRLAIIAVVLLAVLAAGATAEAHPNYGHPCCHDRPARKVRKPKKPRRKAPRRPVAITKRDTKTVRKPAQVACSRCHGTLPCTACHP